MSITKGFMGSSYGLPDLLGPGSLPHPATAQSIYGCFSSVSAHHGHCCQQTVRHPSVIHSKSKVLAAGLQLAECESHASFHPASIQKRKDLPLQLPQKLGPGGRGTVGGSNLELPLCRDHTVGVRSLLRRLEVPL